MIGLILKICYKNSCGPFNVVRRVVFHYCVQPQWWPNKYGNLPTAGGAYHDVELIGYEGEVVVEVGDVGNEVELKAAERAGEGLRNEVGIWKRGIVDISMIFLIFLF